MLKIFVYYIIYGIDLLCFYICNIDILYIFVNEMYLLDWYIEVEVKYVVELDIVIDIDLKIYV